MRQSRLVRSQSHLVRRHRRQPEMQWGMRGEGEERWSSKNGVCTAPVMVKADL